MGKREKAPLARNLPALRTLHTRMQHSVIIYFCIYIYIYIYIYITCALFKSVDGAQYSPCFTMLPGTIRPIQKPS